MLKIKSIKHTIFVYFVFCGHSIVYCKDIESTSKITNLEIEQSSNLYTQGKYDHSIKVIKSLDISSLPKQRRISAYLILGSNYAELGKYKTANIHLKKALVLSKDIDRNANHIKYILFKKIGEVYEADGNFKQAIVSYKEALINLSANDGFNPLSAFVHNNLGMSYLGVNDVESAKKELTKALNIKLEHFETNSQTLVTAYINLAKAMQASSELQSSLEYYKKALAIKTNIDSKESLGLAQLYFDIANVQLLLGEYKNSLTNHLNALQLYRDILGENHIQSAVSYNEVGLVYNNLGQYEKALEMYQKSLSIKKLSENKEQNSSTIYNNIGKIYDHTGQYTRAIESYMKALDLYKLQSSQDADSLATLHNNIGLTKFKQGDYRDAIFHYEKALEIIGNGDEPIKSAIYTNIASLYFTIGKYDRAINYFKETIELIKKSSNPSHPDIALLYHNIGELYNALGNHQQAVLNLTKALTILELSLGSKHKYVAGTYTALATLEMKQGNKTKAFELLQKALKINTTALGVNHEKTAQTFQFMADYFEQQGDFIKALEFYEKSLDITKVALGETHLDTGYAYHRLATLYKKLGDYSKSESLYFKSIGIVENSINNEYMSLNTVKMTISLSDYYIQTVKPLSAYYYGKVAYSGYIHNREKLFSNIDYKSRKAFIESKNHYTPHLLFVASTLLSKQPTSVLQPSPEELKYTPELKPVSNDVIKSDTLSAWLNTKGALYDSENALAMLKNNTTDKAVLALIEDLANQKRLLANLYKQQSGLSNQQTKDSTVITNQRIEQAQQRIAELESQLASRSERYRAELGLKNITVSDMAKSLSDQQLYVDFAYTNEGYYLFSLDNSGQVSFDFLGKDVSAQIDNTVKALQNSIATYNQNIDNKKGGFDNDVALNKANQGQYKALYQLIFAKYPQLLSKPELIISADGALRLIPFEALMDDKNRYLIESKTISYIPSGKEWLRLQKQSKPTQAQTELTIFYNPDYERDLNESPVKRAAITRNTDVTGNQQLIAISFNQLAGTEREGKDIVNIVKQDPTHQIVAYNKQQANRTNLQATQDTKYLHIASHGFFINDNSIKNPMMRSGLALSGAKSGTLTGKVTALELMGLKLDNTDTVILSACETGKVDITDTENVSSLTKAFIQAGANSVIVSLWSVPDIATAELMQDYYQRLYQDPNQNKAQALRQAKLKQIKQGNMPVEWAGFVVSGR